MNFWEWIREWSNLFTYLVWAVTFGVLCFILALVVRVLIYLGTFIKTLIVKVRER